MFSETFNKIKELLSSWFCVPETSKGNFPPKTRKPADTTKLSMVDVIAIQQSFCARKTIDNKLTIAEFTEMVNGEYNLDKSVSSIKRILAIRIEE